MKIGPCYSLSKNIAPFFSFLFRCGSIVNITIAQAKTWNGRLLLSTTNLSIRVRITGQWCFSDFWYATIHAQCLCFPYALLCPHCDNNVMLFFREKKKINLGKKSLCRSSETNRWKCHQGLWLTSWISSLNT